MDIHITSTTIVSAVGVLSALGTVLFWVLKAHKWFLHQEAQDGKIEALKTELKNEIKDLREKHEADMNHSKEERQLVCYGLAACLDGLQQLGCNHSVSDAKIKLDRYLNEKAHQ